MIVQPISRVTTIHSGNMYDSWEDAFTGAREALRMYCGGDWTMFAQSGLSTYVHINPGTGLFASPTGKYNFSVQIGDFANDQEDSEAASDADSET